MTVGGLGIPSDLCLGYEISFFKSDLFLCKYSKKSKLWLLLLEYGYFYKLSAPILSGNTAVSICFASLLLVRTQRRRAEH